MSGDQKAYTEGALCARKTIAEGVPRWIETCNDSSDHFIHPGTGLPICQLTGPPSLAEWNNSFAQGHNDQILVALNSGSIHVDFRPLLISRNDANRALRVCSLGILSPANPRIESPESSFAIDLRRSKSQSQSQHSVWITFHDSLGDRSTELEPYVEPIEIALAREGQVLIFKTRSLLISRDLATTQVLNRYSCY